MERMEELMAIVGFADLLKELHIQDKFREGMTCPAPDCDKTLNPKTVNYIDDSKELWKSVEVDLLSCKCGFQVRRS